MSCGRLVARRLMLLEVCFWVVVYIDPSAFSKILLYYQNYRSWKSRIEKSVWSSSVSVDTWYKELVLTFKISFHEDS